MRSAMVVRSNKSCGGATFVGNNLQPLSDEQEEAQRFAAVVIDISPRLLGKAAKRTTEAAKGWKEGRSLPSTWSILNMAQTIPAVRNYLLGKIGPSAMQLNSPKGLAELVQLLATMTTDERNALMKLVEGRQ